MEYECLLIATLFSEELKAHWRMYLAVSDFLQEINFQCQFISQIYKTTFFRINHIFIIMIFHTHSLFYKRPLVVKKKKVSTPVDSWMKFAYLLPKNTIRLPSHFGVIEIACCLRPWIFKKQPCWGKGTELVRVQGIWSKESKGDV